MRQFFQNLNSRYEIYKTCNQHLAPGLAPVPDIIPDLRRVLQWRNGHLPAASFGLFRDVVFASFFSLVPVVYHTCSTRAPSCSCKAMGLGTGGLHSYHYGSRSHQPAVFWSRYYPGSNAIHRLCSNSSIVFFFVALAVI